VHGHYYNHVSNWTLDLRSEKDRYWTKRKVEMRHQVWRES
jgi:hypothetical protein